MSPSLGSSLRNRLSTGQLATCASTLLPVLLGDLFFTVDFKVNLGTIKRLRGRGGFTVLLSYNTCAGLIFPKKEAAAL